MRRELCILLSIRPTLHVLICIAEALRTIRPVIATGLTEWKYPRIWQKENGQWRLMDHSRNRLPTFGWRLLLSGKPGTTANSN